MMSKRNNNVWKENFLILKFPPGACSVLREHFPDWFLKMYGESLWHRKPCFVPAVSTQMSKHWCGLFQWSDAKTRLLENR